MDARQRQKLGIEEWINVAAVVADRLTECVHVYKHNVDVFMSETERQQKTDLTIKILRRIHALLDQTEIPPEMPERDEQAIGAFAVLFRETLEALPGLSADMQKLLKSPWMKGFPSRIAETLFIANGDEAKGIGSGCPEHGRLPAVLSALLEREQEGESRPSRQEVPVSGEPRRHDVEGSVRWNQQNGGFLRGAGRVE